MEYSYEEVHEAYIKLKTYIYYDTSNLFMRKQLAAFETNLVDTDDVITRFLEYNTFQKQYNVKIEKNEKLSTYEKKLRVFTAALNQFHKLPDFFERYLSRIELKFLPKKLEDINKDSKIITNKRTSKEYIIQRSTIFIDAPIEIHLISVLWILKKGIQYDKDLFEACLGNRLILNKEKDGVVKGSGLFKPYHRQYQKWRDEAVSKAREQLKNNTNVLLLNLDIRDFFYSVRIPRHEIDALSNKNNASQPLNNLYVIFGKTHEVFTIKMKDQKTPYDFGSEVVDSEGNVIHYILPIGLLSSFVLANSYLGEFDNRIIRNVKPAYYGRYVDDILMVIANPLLPTNHENDSIKELNFDFNQYRQSLYKPLNNHSEAEQLSEDDYSKLTDLEQYILRNFFPTLTLIDKPLCLSPEKTATTERVFKLNGYKRLYCQSDKTLLYFFEKSESTLVIDKLKRDLEEKSSEFRNYSDPEETEDFEESAYHLLYDGTDGKIRTLKDYKEDRFGLSVYLSKKIFNTLRNTDKISNDEAEKIVRFFKGTNALSLYTLWERVFVFFLVNRNAEAYVNFYLNCCTAIEGIKVNEKDKSLQIEKIKSAIFEYLDCANELALSLHPKFLSEIKKVKRTYEFSFNTLKEGSEFFRNKYSPTDETSFFISRFRKSNIIRHHYVAQPLLNYTSSGSNDLRNFTDLKIAF